MISLYPAALSVSLFVLWMSSLHVDGCIHVGGLKPLEERLDDAELVVFARPTAIREISHSVDNFRVLDVTVHCVLKNTESTTVASRLSLGESVALSCHENIDTVNIGDDYIIMMKPPTDGIFGGWAYMFDDVNGQSGIETVEINSLMNRCDFAFPSLPSSPPAGATCPAVDDSSLCVGAAGRLSSPTLGSFAILVLVVFTLGKGLVLW